jgi:hypothetical protein
MLLPVAACALVVVLAAGMLRADDNEFPFDPLTGSAVTIPAGDLLFTASDVGGSAIDAKDTLEPQLTVLMVTSDLSVSPGETVGVQTSPTFETWTQ